MEMREVAFFQFIFTTFFIVIHSFIQDYLFKKCNDLLLPCFICLIPNALEKFHVLCIFFLEETALSP